MMHHVESRQQAEHLLREHGVQPTAQRVEVLYHLHESQRHLSADELHATLVSEFNKVSRATVYNTLNMLKEHGLVSEVVVEPNKVLYDANTAPHYHFYDVDTRELTDVPASEVGITCLPLLPDGATFRGLDVVIKIASRPSKG